MQKDSPEPQSAFITETDRQADGDGPRRQSRATDNHTDGDRGRQTESQRLTDKQRKTDKEKQKLRQKDKYKERRREKGFSGAGD